MTPKERKYIDATFSKPHDRECFTSILYYTRHRDAFSKYRLECILYQIFKIKDPSFYNSIVSQLDGLNRRTNIVHIKITIGQTLKDLLDKMDANRSTVGRF